MNKADQRHGASDPMTENHEPRQAIPFVVDDPSTKSLGITATTLAVDAAVLRENIARSVRALSEVLSSASAVGLFTLQSVSLTMTVTAEGGVAFLGVAKTGVTGGITLTFERPK